MIAGLRRAHRWIWGVLALAMPTLVVAARSVRPGLDGIPRDSGSVAFDDPDERSLTFVPDRARGSVRPGGRVRVVLRDEAPLALAYWSGSPADGNALPSDAVLLGPVDAVRVAESVRPPNVGPGTLVIYSLGHHAVLTRAAWPLDEARGG